jgi:hypothetical protein
MDKGRVSSTGMTDAEDEDERARMTLTEDTVRTRLHLGVPPAQIPLSVSNETGVALAVVERMVQDQLAVRDGQERRRRRAWWAVGLVGVGVGFALDQLLGTSRGIGTALLILGVTIGTVMVWWLVNQIRHL